MAMIPIVRKIASLVKSLEEYFVRKDGDTMTGGLAYERSDGNEAAYFVSRRTDTGVSVGFGVGSDGANHGIWSWPLDKWLAASSANGSTAQVSYAKVTISGTSITRTNYGYMNMGTAANNCQANTSTNDVKIIRVEAWNE